MRLLPKNPTWLLENHLQTFYKSSLSWNAHSSNENPRENGLISSPKGQECDSHTTLHTWGLVFMPQALVGAHKHSWVARCCSTPAARIKHGITSVTFSKHADHNSSTLLSPTGQPGLGGDRALQSWCQKSSSEPTGEAEVAPYTSPQFPHFQAPGYDCSCILPAEAAEDWALLQPPELNPCSRTGLCFPFLHPTAHRILLSGCCTAPKSTAISQNPSNYTFFHKIFFSPLVSLHP